MSGDSAERRDLLEDLRGHLAVDRSPHTVRAYLGDVRALLEYLDEAGWSPWSSSSCPCASRDGRSWARTSS
ncbi:site-specific integrase, partial [Streptomonospora algeriensis]